MKLQILNNIFLKEKRFLLELSATSSFPSISPGQFLHLRIEESCDPLLRRPFSIHDFIRNRKNGNGTIKILYEVVGKGTALLSKKKPLSDVDVLGPLGQGFDLSKIEKHQKIYIVAGGMGIAPLFYLARTLAVKKPIVFLGAKTKSHLLGEKEFKKLGCVVSVATDDGSKGFKGMVTAALNKSLQENKSDTQAVICACGPKAMLAAVAELGRRHNAGTYVSMEEFMGCGLGACLGCALRTSVGYKRICHDGPVFDAREIVWGER